MIKFPTVSELLEETHVDDCTEITADEAKEIMKSAKVKIVYKKANWYGGAWTDPRIFHDGKWKSLCRTDMCDDVATGLCERKTAKEWKEHYTLCAADCYGARYNESRFSIIDSMTDG